jgi:hypothetical protein
MNPQNCFISLSKLEDKKLLTIKISDAVRGIFIYKFHNKQWRLIDTQFSCGDNCSKETGKYLLKNFIIMWLNKKSRDIYWKKQGNIWINRSFISHYFEFKKV